MYRLGQAVALTTTWLLLGTPAGASPLPAAIAPPPPFPLITAQTLEREFVAPGVERGTYRLLTSAGPLVVTAVTADPREPTLRLGTVFARDHLVSPGETVSSMAARTGAVAGINGDYFDIGNTNAPVGVLVHDGTLVRSPSSRMALTVTRERAVRFETYRFAGSAVAGGVTIPISAVNVLPPEGGATLLTPAYGSATAAPGTLVLELAPEASTPSGRYRVVRVDRDPLPAVAGYALALGAAAQTALTVVPAPGDELDVAIDTDPSLSDVAAAIGGGPALLSDGRPFDDPQSPGYATRARRIPAAAAARFPDGSVALVVVDGRRPAISIGVDRDELIALLRGLGATDAMQFDSGGSATLVARVLGDERASVRNEPSDGLERPVADGLFVYSDAPPGPPARLVVRPAEIVALPGAAIALRAAIVDAAGHPLGPAHGEWHTGGANVRIDGSDVLHAGDVPLATTLVLERGGVRAGLPLEIIPSVAKIVIVPERPNPDPGGTVALHAQAFDARGRAVEIGDQLRWTALRGTVDPNGAFHAGTADGFVTARIGPTASSAVVRVGRHRVRLAFDERRRTAVHFTSVPANGPGAVAFTPEGTLQLSYDFSGGERAAYAQAGIPVGDALALSCSIEGDGGREGVRVAFTDRYGERDALTFAKVVDWTGAQRRDVRIPATLAPPLVLQSFYAVGSLGTAPITSAGTLSFHDCDLTVPGSVPPRTP